MEIWAVPASAGGAATIVAAVKGPPEASVAKSIVTRVPASSCTAWSEAIGAAPPVLRVYTAVVLAPNASVADTAKRQSPASVGVPVRILPVRAMPGGSAPVTA